MRGLAVIAALFSAWFWLQSARIVTPTEFRFFVVHGDFPSPGSAGLVVRSPSLTELGNKLAEQSELNAKAAGLFAISVILEVSSTLLHWRTRQ